MDALTTIFIIGIAVAVLILAGAIYAWNGDPRSGELSKAAGLANALA